MLRCALLLKKLHPSDSMKVLHHSVAAAVTLLQNKIRQYSPHLMTAFKRGEVLQPGEITEECIERNPKEERA